MPTSVCTNRSCPTYFWYAVHWSSDRRLDLPSLPSRAGTSLLSILRVRLKTELFSISFPGEAVRCGWLSLGCRSAVRLNSPIATLLTFRAFVLTCFNKGSLLILTSHFVRLVLETVSVSCSSLKLWNLNYLERRILSNTAKIDVNSFSVLKKCVRDNLHLKTLNIKL